MSNEFGRGVELVATRSILRRNEMAPPPPSPPLPSAFRDGDQEMNKDREEGVDKSTTAFSGRSRGTNEEEEGVELELHRLSSIDVRRRYHRRLSSCSSPFIKQQRKSNPRGRTQSLLVLLSPSLDAPPQASKTAAAAKAALRFTDDPTKQWPVGNVKSNNDNSTFTTNIHDMLEREKVMQIKKSSDEFEAVFRPKEKKSFEAFEATYRSKGENHSTAMEQHRTWATQTLKSNAAKKEELSSPKKEQHLMEEDIISGAVEYLKKVKNDRVKSLGNVSSPTREEEEVCVGVRASLTKEGTKEQAYSGGKEPPSTTYVKEEVHASSDDTVQENLSSISLPSLVRARRMSPFPPSIANSTRLGDDDGAGVDESPTTTDLNPSRLSGRYPSSNKGQCRGNEDACSTGSPTDVTRFPSSDFCHVHDSVDDAVDRIDDAINGCIGDAFQCGNDNEAYYHHIYASPDEDDNEEMRLRDRRHKKHMKRRTSRRYGSSSGRVGRASHKVRFGPDTILSELTMIKEDSFYNVLQLPFDEFDQ